MTGGVAVAQPGVGRLQSLFPDVTVGGVVVDALEGGAAGGGVARAPKNERMLFCALIASYGSCLVAVQMASSKHARARAEAASSAFAPSTQCHQHEAPAV